MAIVTFGFKRGFRYVNGTRKTAKSRRWMKTNAHRRHRKAVREEIAKGNYDFHFAPFATAWDAC